MKETRSRRSSRMCESGFVHNLGAEKPVLLSVLNSIDFDLNTAFVSCMSSNVPAPATREPLANRWRLFYFMGLRVVGVVAGPVPFREERDEDPRSDDRVSISSRLANSGRNGVHVRVVTKRCTHMSECIWRVHLVRHVRT